MSKQHYSARLSAYLLNPAGIFLTTKWQPIAMAGILFIENSKSLPFLLMMAGLILNISNTTGIPMRHTPGEICGLTGLMLIVYFRNPNHILWKQPS